MVGVDSDEFTVEVHHGEFFVRQGSNRAYVDERVNWFDHCDIDTWSPLWFEDFFLRNCIIQNQQLLRSIGYCLGRTFQMVLELLLKTKIQ